MTPSRHKADFMAQQTFNRAWWAMRWFWPLVYGQRIWTDLDWR